MKLFSSLYLGAIQHARITPTEHRFRYPIRMLGIELGELESGTLSFPFPMNFLFGYNCRKIYSIFDKDYLTQGDGSIREKLLAAFAERGISTKFSSITLVTAPKYFGYVFNPVSFYFCRDHSGRLSAFLAEVNNTFGDRHLYARAISSEMWKSGRAHFSMPKEFHVSPFNPVEGEYRFDLEDIGERLSVKISIFRERKMEFIGQIDCQQYAWSAKAMLSETFKHPLRVWMSLPLILFEAAKLYYGKKMKVFRRPPPCSPSTVRHRGPTLLERWCMKRFEKAMGRLRVGSLRINMPDGTQCIYRGEQERGQQAELVVKDYAFFSELVFRSDLGLGDSYMKGYFQTDDLPGVVACFAVNMKAVGHMSILERLATLPARIFHRFRKNTLFGSRKNIQAHYDLPDQLFENFLDVTRSYSSAIFENKTESLESAQLRKIDAMLDNLALTEQSRLLEIGCGWGSLAIRAVERFQCSVTCLTLSENQKNFVQQRILERGMQDRISVRLQDYRALTATNGLFDAIVSVEMIEAVGRENIALFFQICAEFLKEGGKMALQAITMPEDRITAYQRACDWIQLRIFPGCYVPSLHCLNTGWKQGSGLILESSTNIGPHYAETLRRWRENFLRRKKAVLALGLDSDFVRKWEYYLSYCEAGFDLRMISTYQLFFSKAAESLQEIKRSQSVISCGAPESVRRSA